MEKNSKQLSALQRFADVMRSVRKESDVYFFPGIFNSLEEKIAFFEERGLHVELCPFYIDDTQLNILNGFDAEGQERMKGLMKSFQQLVFDLEKLEYLSSTGLRIFLMMAKHLGGDNLFVDNANELVKEIFDTTGFSSVVVVR